MNFDNKIPVYIQICDYIKKEIVTGNLPSNSKLPSVRELAAKLKVNPNTVQRAYRELEAENLIETKRGMGNYITEDEGIIFNLKEDLSASILSSFIESMQSIGFNSKDILEIIKRRLKND